MPVTPDAEIAPDGRKRCNLCSDSIPADTVRVVVPAVMNKSLEKSKPAYIHLHCFETWASIAWPDGAADYARRVCENTKLDPVPPPLAG